MSCTRRYNKPKQGGKSRRRRVSTRKHSTKKHTGRRRNTRRQRGGNATASLQVTYGWLNQAKYNLRVVNNLLFTADGLLQALGDNAPIETRQNIREIKEVIDSSQTAIETARDLIPTMYDEVPTPARQEGETAADELRNALIKHRIDKVPSMDFPLAPKGGWTPSVIQHTAYDKLFTATTKFNYVLTQLYDAISDLGNAQQKEFNYGTDPAYNNARKAIESAIKMLEPERRRFNIALRTLATINRKLIETYNSQVTRRRIAGPKISTLLAPIPKTTPKAQEVVSKGRFSVKSA